MFIDLNKKKACLIPVPTTAISLVVLLSAAYAEMLNTAQGVYLYYAI